MSGSSVQQTLVRTSLSVMHGLVGQLRPTRPHALDWDSASVIADANLDGYGPIPFENHSGTIGIDADPPHDIQTWPRTLGIARNRPGILRIFLPGYVPFRGLACPVLYKRPIIGGNRK